jgi:cytochrome c oxidase accessory protein FixG
MSVLDAMIMATLLEPEEHVLSTLERDGSRRWLQPRLSRGRYWHARRWLGYALIAFFVVLPHLKISGKPVFLLDVLTFRFTLMGITFLPTDTLLLAFLMVSVFLSIFLATAVFGRVWCGWACPQTVYMEYVFRPLERLFSGTVGRGGRPAQPTSGVRLLGYWCVSLLVSMVLANSFLAYFVGVDRLSTWLVGSPLDHPIPFLVMAATTFLMLFDFLYFREQLCLVACPYGRFQSVLLDRKSLIVGYDRLRGEPRGKPLKEPLPILDDTPARGDCIDCGLCVRTCPTGIDIRQGLQMECVHCTQCIDACDEIMDRIGKPRGLIRYACQDELDAAPVHRFRIRLLLYPVLLTASFGALAWGLWTRSSVDVALLRTRGAPFTVTDAGLVQNALRLKLVNRLDQPQQLSVVLVTTDAAVQLDSGRQPIVMAPGETQTQPLLCTVPRDRFKAGVYQVSLHLKDASDQLLKEIPCLLLGP